MRTFFAGVLLLLGAARFQGAGRRRDHHDVCDNLERWAVQMDLADDGRRNRSETEGYSDGSRPLPSDEYCEDTDAEHNDL